MIMKLFQLLNSPLPVAYFQYFCGIRWRYPNRKNPVFPITQTQDSSNLSREEKKNQRNYVILNRFLFVLAKAGTELAGEPFYYIFFPACAWVFPLNVARRTFLMLSTSMFIGQGLKDLLRQPRPASPPVIRLESMYETEYGMPSTHVMAAVTVSFSFLVFSSEAYQVPLQTGLLIACSWSSAVVISRIYLGMHTILEVLTGTLLSFAIIFTTKPVVEWLETTQLEAGAFMSLAVGIGCLLLARIMFALDNEVDLVTGKPRWNTARGDLAEILGWCAGFLIGSKYAFDYGILSLSTKPSETFRFFDNETVDVVLRWCIRFAIGGGVILLPFTTAARKLLQRLFIYAHGLSSLKLEEAKKMCPVELPYKFLSALLSGLVGTLVVPSVLQYYHIW